MQYKCGAHWERPPGTSPRESAHARITDLIAAQVEVLKGRQRPAPHCGGEGGDADITNLI